MKSSKRLERRKIAIRVQQRRLKLLDIFGWRSFDEKIRPRLEGSLKDRQCQMKTPHQKHPWSRKEQPILQDAREDIQSL